MPLPTQVQFKNVFKSGFLLVFLALLATTILDQLFNKQIESLIQSPHGLSNMIWFWGALSLIASLVLPLFTSLLCCHTLVGSKESIFEFIHSKFELSLIEALRAWGKTFLWCFLFIIPGLIQGTYYVMTPFVVIFSKKYAAGEVDALQYSKLLSKKFWGRLNLWLLVFYAIIPLTISICLDEYQVFRTHPFLALLCVLLETVIYFLFHFLVLKLFLKYLNEFEPPPEKFESEAYDVTHV